MECMDELMLPPGDFRTVRRSPATMGKVVSLCIMDTVWAVSSGTPTYILVIIGVVICLIASARVKSTYSKFEKVRSHSGVTAAGGGTADSARRGHL